MSASPSPTANSPAAGAASLLDTPAAEMSVKALIGAHRTLVEIDEAGFDAQGNPYNPEQAAVVLAAERQFFSLLLNAPCLTSEDVQAKVAYILFGTVGDRDPLINCVIGEEGESLSAENGPLFTFLNSLIVTDLTDATAPAA